MCAACQQKEDEYLHRPAFNNGSSVNENNLASAFVVGVLNAGTIRRGRG